MAETPSTRKVQITVPAVDTSVIEWLDLQYSVSESIRRLIREAVAREGFVDVANRPVRPPAQPVHIAEDLSFEHDARPAVPDPEIPAPAKSTAGPESTAGPQSTPAAKSTAGPKSTAPSAPAPAEKPAPQPAGTRRSRSTNTSASATIDDLLGL